MVHRQVRPSAAGASSHESTRRRGQSAFHGLESLESRQLLSADLSTATLPQGAVVEDWGGVQQVVKPGSYVLSFDDYLGTQQAELVAREVATRLGVSVTSAGGIGRGGFAWFEGQGRVTAEAANALIGVVPHLKSVSPDQYYQPTALPNDSRFNEQYALSNVGQFINVSGFGTAGADIHVTGAWDQTIGSRDVIIGIIDTGINYNHPDLAQNIWTNPGEIAGNGIDDDGNGYVDDVHGFDFGNSDSDPMDEASGRHGTQVASCVGAVGNNGIGVSGVAWNVSMMALKIADSAGRLSTRAIVAAHDYATLMRQRGVNLVATNNSYGGFAQNFYTDQNNRPDLTAEEAAISRFLDSGGTFIASAGNDSINNDSTLAAYPASFNLPGIIAVASTDNNDTLSDFSNYGVRTVDVAAPGQDILMAQQDGGYAYNDGTSFSGPIVAGVVALLKAAKPNASAVEIREALINGSDPLPSLQGKIRSGGRINAARSLQIIGISGPVVRSVSPGPVAGQINPSTGQAFNTVTVQFSKDIDGTLLTAAGVVLRGSGPDDTFGNANDVIIPISSVTRSLTNPRQVTIALNLASLAGQRLPVDTYRLVLSNATFRDTDGKYLNGNSTGGTDETYDFRIVAVSGDFETNDTLAQATPVAFDSSGQANFTGVTLGNGLSGNLDVDLFRVDIPRGGLISAETIAARLAQPSNLDSYLRLFDANGLELAANDNSGGRDSFVSFFVQTGGTYYVGVSGFGNGAYDPTVAASGASQSTGTYNLRLTVQISADDVVTIPSTDPNLPRRIPVDPAQTQGVTTSTLTVTDSREILDVNVKLDISHTFDADLVISLISPLNREVVLFNRRGGSGDNLTNTIFDDEGSLAIAGGAAPFAGTFRPEASLGGFDGTNGNGTWTLKITDAAGLNSGTLNSWSLQFTFGNDIFGAFESNDTLNTAAQVPNFSGTGSTQLTAFLGDGGFGSYDRDIFKFTADGGTSLTATVAPTAANNVPGTFNSALRLFDSTGTEIKLSNPTDTLTSSINNYIFSSGGVYYIAVSDANNTTYNPTLVGDSTSRPAVTTGGYALTFSLAAGVSDGALVLRENVVDVGIDTSGILNGTDAQGTVGLSFNGIDFLPNQNANQRFIGANAAGDSFANFRDSAQLPFSIADESDAFNSRVTTKSTFKGLKIERSLSFGTGDGFVAVDVYLTNTSSARISSVAWMEGMNPDPGVSLGDQRPETKNDVSASGKFVSAQYVNNQFSQGLTMALAAPSAETRVKATTLSRTQVIRDPLQLIALPVNDPNGANADRQLVLLYNIGDLAAGASTSFRYFILFGNTPADVDALYTQINSGTGTGHLTANPAAPATELLSTGTGPAVTVPTLPYREYYSEGFYGDNIFTFLPIGNVNDQPAHVVVIARYEQGTRDQLVGDFTIAANSRSGLTLITPDLYRNGTALAGRVNPGGGVPAYALEIRSDRPVASTFSHYDLNQVAGAHVAIGEAFTTRVSTSWTFGDVNKGSGNNDFITFYNPNAETQKVTIKFYPVGGGTVYTQEFRTVRLDGSVADGLEGYRRGGVAVNDIAFLPEGKYGVTVECNIPIVAALSHFDTVALEAAGQVGDVGMGSLTGVIPEGQFGLNATAEQIGVLNASASSADVTFSFLFDNGSAYRTLLTVPAGSNKALDVQSLPNFPSGKPYAVYYSSTQPVSISSFSNAFNDGVSSAFAETAYTTWGFGEGFRPGDNDNHPGVVEYLRLYNPANTDTTVEITINYDGTPGGETFRRTLPARRVSEFTVDQFVTGARRLNSAWYTLSVKGPVPIVAYMAHYDRVFPGGFGTLGTPLGLSGPVT
ncbi:MAG: S8 family serine peptidase [Planctomycetes bacterium]|nr:S8 family serine peptidase [Planctomycetota bacterium]